ncbi:hypothetical protein [Allopusillimonas ginsengisoli]|uniref:hypothetical protein n=1 Tax=Allopusillimonas ginsengisoli TaxID=453575 RepID=UPI001020653B|nr:hypothetical protein [Allopusillimonas ginsengisoli]TEA77339.1 hypothetical protein ERE07_15440 [Allopusillimonas ginsengisoli]
MPAQKGFVLLELTVAALIATLLAVWGAHALATAVRDTGLQANAKWMLMVRDGARQYLKRYGEAIRHAEMTTALVPAGFADWSTPTLAELKAYGFLPASFPLQTGQGAAVVRVLRDGVCPGADCRLEAIVHSERPLVDARSGRVDEQSVAQWLMAAEGLGGWVSSRHSNLLRGSAFTLRNPSWHGPALLPGTVALSVRHDAAGDFLRVRDTRDPDFQGPLTVQDNVLARSDIQVEGHIRLHARSVAGVRCDKEGALAFQTHAGLLGCVDGVWQPAVQGVAGGYVHNSITNCTGPGTTANKYTGRCACPPWSHAFQVAESGPQLFSLGITRRYLCLN